MIKAKTKKSDDKKRYVIYTRCSTDDQAQGDYTTLDAQAHHCKNMLDAFGYELADIGKKGVINDDGYSGKDLNRPGIQKILSEVQKKRSFDGIIFFRLDRLTRNPRDLYSLIDLFRDNDIDFISVRENLDSSTAIGRVVIGILGLLSAFERELTGERVKASAIARVRQGRWVGGKVPYGYKLIPDGDRLPIGTQPHKIVVDEKIAPHLQIIWEMAADNKSLTQIGMELEKRKIKTATGKSWRRQALSTILKNPFYTGYLQYSGETHKGRHPAIVDKNLWEKANKVLCAKLPRHKFVKKPKEYCYLVESLIKCGECGSHMITYFAKKPERKYFYYECGRAKQGLGCSNKRISATVFDEALIEFFKRASKDQEIIVRAIGTAILESKNKTEELQKIINEKQSLMDDLKHETQKLLDLAMNGTIPQGSTLKDKMDILELQIEKITNDLSKLQAQKRIAQINAHSGEYLYQNIRSAIENIDKVSPETQKQLLKALIKDIVIFNDKIEINMYIRESTGESEPADQPDKEKRPTESCEASNKESRSSADCPIWLAKNGVGKTTEHSLCQLLVRLYKCRGKRIEMSIGEPLPEHRSSSLYVPRNVAEEALRIKEYLDTNPNASVDQIAEQFGITMSRISQLLTINNNLPDNFISNLAQSKKSILLRKFTGKKLLQIASLQSEIKRLETIKNLMPKSHIG
ncbi:MAG: recombinase family protein [Candidatus Auribacterota bacterium]|jgi:site-specific DNA recombinase|nr:recombinase family protein [Candidatus Auribacterota bacterium]